MFKQASTFSLPAAFQACALLIAASHPASADEILFGRVRGAETLPAGSAEAYTTLSARTGKNEGTFHAFDLENEIEYGFTDRFQVGVSVIQHYFDIHGNGELPSESSYKFGGFDVAPEINLLSPFKDRVGVAIRSEIGYLTHDNTAGLPQDQVFVAPQVLLQKNFLDDTLILEGNFGAELAWGKRPAEPYSRELSFEERLGISYRFVPGWFAGLEANFRTDYQDMDLSRFDHTVLYAGPSVHYGAEHWWMTGWWGYQVWGDEVDQAVAGKAYAKETRNFILLRAAYEF